MHVLRPNAILKQTSVSMIFHNCLGTRTTKKSAGGFARVQSLFADPTLITLQYSLVSKLIVPN
jgi:hypothetical protein